VVFGGSDEPRVRRLEASEYGFHAKIIGIGRRRVRQKCTLEAAHSTGGMRAPMGGAAVSTGGRPAAADGYQAGALPSRPRS
jgi:hypothetical protein